MAVLKNLGRLQTMSLEEQARQQGAKAPPVSPGGAAGIGANEDQAKMAGTGAQKLNAMRMATRESQTLGAQERRQELGQKKATTQEQALQQKVEAAGGVGSLGARVYQMATKSLAQAASQTGANLKVDNTKLQALGISDPTTQTQVAAQFQALNNPNSTPEQKQVAINELNKLGIPGTNADQLLKAMVSDADAKTIADSAWANVKDKKFNMADLKPEDWKEMGTSPEALSALLGVKPEQLGKYSYAELESAMEMNQNKNYANTEQIQGVLNDPAASAADKMEANRRLRELGVIGTRKAEDKINNIQAQIEDGDSVNILGQSMKVDEILADTSMQYIIDESMKNPEAMKRLEQELPEMAQYVKNNKQALQDAIAKADPAVKQYNQTQTENKALSTIPDLGPAGEVSSDVMKALIPGWGQNSATKFQKPAILQMASDPNIPAAQRQNIVAALNQVSSNPDLVKEMSTMTMQDLTSSGALDDPGGWANRVKGYMTYQGTIKNFVPSQDPKTFKGIITGGNPQLWDSMWETQKKEGYNPEVQAAIKRFGLDADGDNRMDSLETAQATLFKENGASLRDVMRSRTNPVNLGDRLQQFQKWYTDFKSAQVRAKQDADTAKKQAAAKKAEPKKANLAALPPTPPPAPRDKYERYESKERVAKSPAFTDQEGFYTTYQDSTDMDSGAVDTLQWNTDNTGRDRESGGGSSSAGERESPGGRRN